MGWKFRKSIKIFPGVKLNFGKKGFTSATIGGKFAKTNISSKGTRNTYTFPKTGLSYQTELNPKQNYSTNNSPLNRYCSQCGLMNAPNSNFCSSCGGVCPPNLQTNNFNGSKIVVPLIILGSFIGFCAFCGIIGSIDKSASNRTSDTSNSKLISLVSTPKTVATPIETYKTKSSLNRINGKTADVISENANLRAAGSINSNVLGTIPQGETIGFLKQKGAWFYVATSVGKGWVHGNTIRLNSSEITPSIPENAKKEVVDSTDINTFSSATYTSPSTDYRPKTVYVRGYTRKDGTYVAPHTRRAPRRR